MMKKKKKKREKKEMRSKPIMFSATICPVLLLLLLLLPNTRRDDGRHHYWWDGGRHRAGDRTDPSAEGIAQHSVRFIATTTTTFYTTIARLYCIAPRPVGLQLQLVLLLN
uniref:Uncharacterized protein n=1 Tax=Anopheles merus TaxID=30066 RepID=A0A182VKK1_ANOME